MPPQIILIRHAEAYHNQTNESSLIRSLLYTQLTPLFAQDYTIHDPSLTQLGLEQCQALHNGLKQRFEPLLPDLKDVAIVVSPMRRTLQTADLGLGWLMEKGVKAVANADWQENSAKPCDTGSDISDINRDFSHVDFTQVDPVWPDKSSAEGQAYAYTRSSILARGQRALAALHKRTEKLVFVVSHSGFLRLGVAGWWWMNADYRVFDFEERDEGGALGLRQDERTVKGGLGLSWDEPVELGLDLPEEGPGNMPVEW